MLFRSKRKGAEVSAQAGQETPAAVINSAQVANSPIPVEPGQTPASPADELDVAASAMASQSIPAPNPQHPLLSQHEFYNRAAQAKRTSAAFGQVVSVFMRSHEFKRMTLGDLEALVVPAVSTGQFLIAEAHSKQNGMTAAVATVLWASVSEEVDRRLGSEPDKPVKLEPKDWKSGDTPWLLGVAGDKQLVGNMLKKLQTEVFEGRPIKMRSRGEDGHMTVTTIVAG